MTVTLAPVVRADGPELIAGTRASHHLHHPWVSPFTDQPGFMTWLDGHASGASVGLIAREAETGRICGVTTLSQIFLKAFRSAYLGYWGLAGMTGRGLMTDAIRQTLRHGFDEIGLHRIEANIQPGNSASIALARRVGFRHEGFSPRYLFIDGAWRDHERFAITAEDPIK